MDIVFAVITHAVAFGGGCAFYRWMVKRNAPLLEKWAAQAKAAGRKL